jgi:hypothetical protein
VSALGFSFAFWAGDAGAFSVAVGAGAAEDIEDEGGEAVSASDFAFAFSAGGGGALLAVVVAGADPRSA